MLERLYGRFLLFKPIVEPAAARAFDGKEAAVQAAMKSFWFREWS
jgi:hypothetical protein